MLEESENYQPVTTPELFECIWKGSMPGLVSGQYPDRNMYYSSYISSYLERDGKLCPLEIKKTATPDKRLVRTFGVIDKEPLQIGTGTILCMAEQFSAFDRENLIVPIGMI